MEVKKNWIVQINGTGQIALPSIRLMLKRLGLMSHLN